MMLNEVSLKYIYCIWELEIISYVSKISVGGFIGLEYKVGIWGIWMRR